MYEKSSKLTFTHTYFYGNTNFSIKSTFEQP